MKSMDKNPKAKKSGGKISKSDWNKMPKNKQGIITNDTIKKTRAAKGAKPAAAKKKSYPKLMMKSSSKPMSK